MTLENINFAPVARFYQENDRKIIFAVVLILSLYLIAFAAKLSWQIIPQPESSSANITSAIQQNANIRSNQGKTNLQALLALNLFGDASAKPVQAVEQSVTDAPETKLNLVLSGVVASTTPDVGAAVIEYRNNQNTYGIGDKIEGTQVTLDEIYPDRVIIKNRVTRETLMLEGVDFEEANRLREQNRPFNNVGPQNTEIEDEAISANRSQNQPIRPNPSADIAAIRAAQQRLREEPASFADFIRLSPYVRDGSPLGYQVSPGNDPSLFNEAGLQAGDVVIELNGYDLSDTAQALEAVALLNDAESLDFEVLRDEEVISLSLDIPRDNDE